MDKPVFGIPWQDQVHLTDLDFADDIVLQMMTSTEELVDEADLFTYLRSIMSKDVNCRIGEALVVFQWLSQISSTSITTATRFCLFIAIVILTTIYQQTWKHMKQIAFQQRCQRRILQFTYHNLIMNEEGLRRAGTHR
ncbi:hypothetical protein AOLI_G00267540 [Acnodon oligacanthus]